MSEENKCSTEMLGNIWQKFCLKLLADAKHGNIWMKTFCCVVISPVPYCDNRVCMTGTFNTFPLVCASYHLYGHPYKVDRDKCNQSR